MLQFCDGSHWFSVPKCKETPLKRFPNRKTVRRQLFRDHVENVLNNVHPMV